MAFDISLTTGMRADLTSLQGTAQLLNRTQQRLSSGKAVNSATDNPAAYFAAQDHVNHASDLSARKSDMGEAIQAVNAANAGITNINTLINQAQGLVQTAQSANATTRASLATQFNTLRTQIDQLASDSGYNGKNFLQGDTLSVLFNETGTSSLTVTGFSGDSAGLGITQAQSGAVTATYTNEAMGAGTLTGQVGAGTYTLANKGLVASASVVVTQSIRASGEAVSATVTTGAVYVLSGFATSGLNISLSSFTVSAGGVAITALSAGTYTLTVSGGSSIVLTFNTAIAATMTVSYNASNTMTAGQEYTISNNGGGATAGTINFAAAESGSISVTYTNQAQMLWGDDTALQTDTNNLNTAITNLRTQASTMAANLSVITTRQTWSQSMIDNLQTGSDNLTLADMNEEGANMLALQTRQQLGIQALSLASQSNQSVMRLFG